MPFVEDLVDLFGEVSVSNQLRGEP